MTDRSLHILNGDTSCQRNLDQLVENNFLAVRNNEYFLPQEPINA